MTLRRLAAPLALTAIAALLRYHRFVDFYPNVDHAYPVAQAIQWLHTSRWPVLGQTTSILFANPPGMSYLVALPWVLFGALWGVHYFTVSLNLLAVPLVYAVVRLRVNDGAGLAAGWLLAVNPWLSYFGIGTWVQGLLIFWSTLTFALLAWALFGPHRRRPLLTFAALTSLTALTQMYLLAFLTLLPVTVMVWLRRRHIAARSFAAGLILFTVVTGLYAYHLAADWPNQSVRLQNFLSAQAPLQARTDALEHALRFVTGRDYELLWGREATLDGQVRRAAGLTISWGLTAVVWLGVVRAAWRIVTRTRDASFWLATLAWWGLPVLVLTVQRHPVQIAYLLLTVPAGCVLAAPVLARAWRHWFGGVALVAMLTVNSFLLLHGDRVQIAGQPAGLGLDALSVRGVASFQTATRQIVDKYNLSEFYVGLDSNSLMAKVGREITAVNWYGLPDFEIFPIDRPAVYVALRHGSPGEPVALAERVAEIVYPGGDFLTFDAIPSYRRDQLTLLTQQPVEWPTAQGLTLVGYDLSVANHEVVAYWTVDALDVRRQDWLFVPYLHLVNEGGQLVANVGAPTLPGYLYRAGDVYRFVLRFSPVPPGRYTLGLGLVDGVHGLDLTFLPPGGEPRPAFTTSIVIP